MIEARPIAAIFWLGVALTMPAAAHAQVAEPPSSGPAAIDPRPARSPDGTSKYSENDIRALIESHGLRHVTRLRLDANGTWHALAEQYGTTIEVSVDQRGNLAVARERR